MTFDSVRLSVAALSCLGMLLSPMATAAEPLAAVGDVALGEGGFLIGKVVDTQGVAVPLVTVTLADTQREITRVRTDQEGQFSVLGLRGGVYRLSCQGQVAMYRLWARDTAPPVALQGVLLVVGADIVRGQYGNSHKPFASAGQWIGDHPFVTLGLIGAAIALPIALSDDEAPATP